MAIRFSRGTRLLSAVSLLAFTVLITWMLSTRIGMMPPMGHLTNPWQGFWQNMERDGIPDLLLDADQLRSTVTVRYDDRGVPHIFADNDYDLYFAQGLVTARDRLWQVDFQTRAAAGRLAEIVGPDAVDFDRAQRRLGMMYGAEINAASMGSDPRTSLKVQAYTDGYNAWLDQLRPRDYPVEFKIFDSKPESFSPLSAALLLMNMSQTLSAGTRAHAQTNARALLDEDVYRLLYPDELPWTDPIIPPDQNWGFDPIPPPTPNPGFVPSIVHDLPLQEPDPGIGSNSWAVDGSKSASGYPVLASDPHLSVNLPSIWYEIQLHSTGANDKTLYKSEFGNNHPGNDNPGSDQSDSHNPDSHNPDSHNPNSHNPDSDRPRKFNLGTGLNTYGVSLPGAPGVVIGFNEHVAWGVTNTGSNTLDIFEIEFRDDSRTEYLHDGQWKPVRQRIEKIHVRGGKTVIDTVLYTHHGPITQGFGEQVAHNRFPAGHAIRWVAHLPDNDILLATYKFNRARNQDEFESALRHFTNLPQNITYADSDGNISMGHMGLFPIRFFGQGSYISNGRDPAYDWNQFVPFEHLPRSFNPERGFVSSANQAPATRSYPYYLGRSYYGFSRGARINQILAESENITGAFFEEMLMDNYSLHAEKILPFLLSLVDTAQAGDSKQARHTTLILDTTMAMDVAQPVDTAQSGDTVQSFYSGSAQPDLNSNTQSINAYIVSTVINMLKEWDYTFYADSPIALFYANWEQRLIRALWEPMMDSTDRYIVRPAVTTTLRLLLDNKHHVIPADIPETVNRTFREALEHLVRRHGSDPAEWNYGRNRTTRVGHLAMLPGFGRDDFIASGRPEAINATGSTSGPSWRMVVELGPELRARGHYPGGQTGNPGHPGYDRFIDDWAAGNFYDLLFWRNKSDAPEQTASTMILRKRKR